MHPPRPLPSRSLLVDGLRLTVAEHGAADAPVVVLLAGALASPTLWAQVARDLEHQFRVLAVDLVGLGGSEVPADRSRYRLARQARLLLDLLDALGVPRAAVAGHGLGGTVAVHLAALAPERVAALALLGSPVHQDVWPTPDVSPPWRPWRSAGSRGPDARRGIRRLLRAMDLVPAQAALRLVDCPALVLWGDDDAVLSASYGRRLAAALPAGVWVPVAQGGHLLPVERPERVAEELAAFLAEAR